MSYRFRLNETIAEEVRRIGLEQIEMADAKLAARHEIAAALHDARRCLKRLRALLRLIRPGLDSEIYKQEAERLAGVGRLLSGARDLDVMQETLAKLERRFGALPNNTTKRLQDLMVRNAAASKRGRSNARQAAHRLLKQSCAMFTTEPAGGVDLDDLAEGAGRAYRKARRAFKQAYRKPSDEGFHAWRKASQTHWRHMALLSRAWPEALGARASEAKELSRLLGEDHDYAVLRAFADSKGRSVEVGDKDLATLAARCAQCQSELREMARPRGERLFVEAVNDLERNIVLYWTSAKRISSSALPAKAAGRTRSAALKQKQHPTR